MKLRPLLSHQQGALEYARKRSRIALFMEMRLGKTCVAIRWARHRRLDRVLILGPTSVLPSWMDELLLEGVRPGDLHLLTGTTAVRKAIANEIDTGFALANYETVRFQPDILQMNWDGIILDESTRIRNPKAKITKLLLRLGTKIPNRAVLSGLPAPESGLDYWCQMAFLHGDFGGCYNYWSFRQAYFQLSYNGYDWKPKPTTLHDIKKEVHSKAYVLTRKSAGVGSRKVYERRTVEIDKLQARYYKQVAREYAFRDNLQTKWATTREIWLARLAGGFSPDKDALHPVLSINKTNEILNLLDTELRHEPLVIWFRFNQELSHVTATLLEYGYKVRMMTGKTTMEERKRLRDDFQEGKYQILCAQVKVGQFGIDLSRASTAIYYSNAYDYEVRAQSEDRIIHPTKKEPVLYIDLITRTTVDKSVVDTLGEKGISAKTFMSRLLVNMRRDYYLHYGFSQPGNPIGDTTGQAMVSRARRLFPNDTETNVQDRKRRP